MDLNGYFTKDLCFAKTQIVILDLLSQEGIADNFQHIVWFDNLFMSVHLLSRLELDGFGAAGAVRMKKSQRETNEAKRGTNTQR